MVLNCADPSGRDNAEALEALGELPGIVCLLSFIGRRKAFPAAAAQGLGMVEVAKPDPKAVSEIQALVTTVFGGSV